MRITALVENTSSCDLPVEHGLSLYIRLSDGRTLLFDMGQGTLFAQNAERLGLSIAGVDIAVVSHGHYDHGGGLRQFLALNSHAPVYLRSNAFQPHYSYRDTGLCYIGLESELQHHPQLRLCNQSQVIAPGIQLITHVTGQQCLPIGNRLLFGPERNQRDDFSHEQSLLIHDGSLRVLIAGCAHTGIVNIIHEVRRITGQAPTHVFAGMHLVKSGLRPESESQYIADLCHQLLQVEGCQYYTMHCTGIPQYEQMLCHMPSALRYLSCGDSVTL